MTVTTRPRGFAPYNPQAGARALIEATLVVLKDYADYLPLTLRQIYYRLVVAFVLGKTEAEYSRLGEVLNRARRGRLISFDAIRDDGFTVSAPWSCTSLKDAMESLRETAEEIQIDRQAGQERRLRVWCEAAGMVPQLERVAFKYGVPVLSSGGFDSVTAKHQLGRDLAASGPLTILHLGDLDPSGEHMFSSLGEDVGAFATEYGGDVEFVRIAVTREQVDLYQLPTAPPKETDRRSFAGILTTQCEALDPAILAEIVKAAIVARIDQRLYDRALRRETLIRGQLWARLA
jgi:hypothetical protein